MWTYCDSARCAAARRWPRADRNDARGASPRATDSSRSRWRAPPARQLADPAAPVLGRFLDHLAAAHQGTGGSRSLDLSPNTAQHQVRCRGEDPDEQPRDVRQAEQHQPHEHGVALVERRTGDCSTNSPRTGGETDGADHQNQSGSARGASSRHEPQAGRRSANEHHHQKASAAAAS